MLKTLVAARPKAPLLTPEMVAHGSDDEAWLYRVQSRETWVNCKAMDWLRETAGRKPIA